MKLQIRNIIKFQDSSEGDNFNDLNNISLDWSYTADSKDEIEETEDGVKKDFKINNFNKYSFELKDDNNFSVNIQQDLLSSIDNEVVSIHIFCYQSTKQSPYRLPLKFNISFENSDFNLGKCSEFTFSNIENLLDDVVISDVTVPEGCKANLIILIGTK
jgi:hypothetical protein